MDKMQRGGDYDLAGLLKKLVNIGVDDLRRQLKNPLKDSQVRRGIRTHWINNDIDHLDPLGEVVICCDRDLDNLGLDYVQDNISAVVICCAMAVSWRDPTRPKPRQTR